MRLLLAAAAAAATAAASAPVVWHAASSAGVLVVYADDSYALFAAADAAEAWLVSGPTSVHVNGAWFSTAAAAPAPAPNCSAPLHDIDCRNSDLYYFNTTSIADCCENCSATPACGAWTFTGVTEQRAADPPPSWANRCYIKAGCDHQGYSGHTSGIAPSAAPQPLTRVGAGPSGDGSGGYEITYDANGTSIVTTFALNKSSDAFVFSQRFPQGAAGGVNILTPVNSTSVGGSGGLREFASSGSPATQFPVFLEAPNSTIAAGLGYVSWAGRFFYSMGASSGGANAAFGDAAVGAEGGPVVLFAGGAAGAAGAALVLSPLDNFKSSMLGRPFAGAGAAAGVSGYVTSLPANFSTSTVALFGAAGVTDVMHAWGAALREHHGGAAKLADPSSEQLTYWTDK